MMNLNEKQNGAALLGYFKGCASVRAEIELVVHRSEARDASPLKSPTRQADSEIA